jgi:hypothetical protein
LDPAEVESQHVSRILEVAAMKSIRSSVFSWDWRLVFSSFALAVAVAAPVMAQTAAPVKKGTVEHIKVHGVSLEGNLEGDSPDRDVFIYLPPSYATTGTGSQESGG